MKTITLGDLAPGLSATVQAVEGEDDFRQRLFDLGFLPGTLLKLIRKAPLGDPLQVNLRGYHLAIRKKDARKILLNPLL